MTIALYVDHQIDLAIVKQIRARGVDSLRAIEDRMETAPDSTLLERAIQLDRVVVTEDKDFLRLATSYMREGRAFPGVIFIPQRRWDLGRIVSHSPSYRWQAIRRILAVASSTFPSSVPGETPCHE